HPALWCSLLFAAWGWRSRWLIPLVLVGAIGQVSLVNSFCHLHTPIALTLARVWNGLWVGALVGVPLALAIRTLTKRGSAAPPASGTRAEELPRLKVTGVGRR